MVRATSDKWSKQLLWNSTFAPSGRTTTRHERFDRSGSGRPLDYGRAWWSRFRRRSAPGSPRGARADSPQPAGYAGAALVPLDFAKSMQVNSRYANAPQTGDAWGTRVGIPLRLT